MGDSDKGALARVREVTIRIRTLLLVVLLATGCLAATPVAGTELPAAEVDRPADTALGDHRTLQVSSITQYGITWSFDATHTVGRFANGDWWVVGPVTLTGITPASTSQANGENINPGPGDHRYTAELDTPVHQISFPATVEPGSSIVKTVTRTDFDSDPDHRGQLQTAAVLTVVEAPPPDDGATVFRPPYVGDAKPYHSTTELATDLLPALSPPDGVTFPSLDEVADTFARVQLDHHGGTEDNRRLHPVDNLVDYGSWLAQNTHTAALRLMFDNPIETKRQALINYVQYGIDLGAMVEHDTSVCADAWERSCAGHGQGRTLPLVFAATMLGSTELQAVLDETDHITENWNVTWPEGVPTPLFGESPCSVELYWQVINGGSGPATCLDPYGAIDGGDSPGSSYQACCMSQSYKGAVTAMHLMPQLADSWPDSENLIVYVDRWVTFGTWTAPDPEDRFTDRHGTNADGGEWRIPLADALWDEHNLDDRVDIDWPTR